VRIVSVLGVLALVAACNGGASSEIGEIPVGIDPNIARKGALHEGFNRFAPYDKVNSTVEVTRTNDGGIQIDVSWTRGNGYSTVSQVRLPPGSPPRNATVITYTHGEGGRWPGRKMRGTVNLNRADTCDFGDGDLLVQTDVAGWCSGSDLRLQHTVEITEADLR